MSGVVGTTDYWLARQRQAEPLDALWEAALRRRVADLNDPELVTRSREFRR